MPSRSRIALDEARKWADDGVITAEQLELIRSRYAGADEGAGGRQLLVGIGVALFAIAVGTLVIMTFEDTDPVARMFIVFGAAAAFVATGLALRPRPDLQRLAGALVATAGPLWVLAWGVGGEGIDGTSFEPVGLAIMMLGAAAIWAASWVRFPGSAFAGHLSLGAATLLMVGGYLEGGGDDMTMTLMGYTVVTWGGLALVEVPDRTRQPWMTWSIAATAITWVPAAFMWSFELYDLNAWGAAGLVAVGGVVALAHGLSRGMGPVSAGGALSLVVAAIFLGASEGGVWGTVAALVAVGAAFVAAGQLKPGWWRPRADRG